MRLIFKEQKKINIYFRPYEVAFNILHQMIWLLILSIAVCRSSNPAPGCHLSPVVKNGFEYKYSQDGDIIIGGIFTVHGWMAAFDYRFGIQSLICLSVLRREYRHIRAFIFAINQINRNPDILPNITLGYHLYDSCGSENKAVRDVLQILCGHKNTVPNYRCMEHGKVAGFIGDLNSHTTIAMAKLLNIYGYSQISYGARDPTLSDRKIYPHFFRTIHNDQMQFLAITKLLKVFHWNWVGIISSEDDSGERELQQLSSQLTAYGICIEFKIQYMPKNKKLTSLFTEIIKKSSAQIIIICGTISLPFVNYIRSFAQFTVNRTFLFPALWSSMPEIALPYESRLPVNCTLVFSLPICTIPGVQEFLDDVNPPHLSSDPLMEDIWITEFWCKTRNELKNVVMTVLTPVRLRNCSMKDRFQGYFNYSRDAIPYRVYIAVFNMAQALHDMYLFLSNNETRNNFEINEYKEEVTTIKQYWVLTDRDFDTTAYASDPRYHKDSVLKSVLMDIEKHQGKDTMHVAITVFRVQKEKYPISLRMSKKQSLVADISCLVMNTVFPIDFETVDNENCVKCSDTEWPNEARNQCIAKVQDFQSYEMNTITSVFSVTAVLFSAIVDLITGIFIFFRNNQIVRANNRNLSFIILISLKLSLLCVLLFLGRPVDITCMLRQICFGIIFTIAVSSVLAKTIMVCIAFKATRPGSYWRKWMGVKLPYSLVLICSSVQVLNGVIWLSVSPPFQEFNMDTYPGTIIIQCNEGSVLAFYFMLGYMGLLAAVSFFLAFMVRTLPDIYNEAKYITFSMLVFCSVWVCAIPAYLSSNGKNMVIVEVFAILASCIGILGCMFFPKCYYLLRRPEVSRKILLVQQIQNNSL
ncbi:vomeronasal type-2 receptor 26-like [Pseudophryne corroboree]|uniref:vomeronasal type-2 receptor 26-like n=1 Tax=Pseudophryne corroboree TaxID=495146 RepID=UPI003081399F